MRNIDQRSILFVFGTRPEAIKLMPVIRSFRADATFQTHICATGQHRELVDGFLASFDLRPDFDLNVMTPGQSLTATTAKIITACEEVLDRLRPALVVVQGDTTSALAGAIAASQRGVPVAHVEAGLRSHRKSSPFPEELNRTLIGHIAELHFAPGKQAAANLRREGITRGVHIVGNTVVDALKVALDSLSKNGTTANPGKKKLVATLHRRESFGTPLRNVCAALRKIAGAYDGVEIFCPVHPNPEAQQIIRETLAGVRNVHLLAPLSYLDFIALLSDAALVISDSGGVLEEAETLGLPVLVAREVTERVEALSDGHALLVGTDADTIFAEAVKLLDAPAAPFHAGRPLRRTFGDGQAAARILRIIRCHLTVGTDPHPSTQTLLASAA